MTTRSTMTRLCAAAALAYCSYAMCRLPILPLFARSLGASHGMVGLVVAASTITGVFLKLPAGALSDVFGRRALLIAAALVFAAMPFAYLVAATLAGLIAVRALHGSATAMAGPVASAALSDVAPADRRGQWLGTYAAVQGAGQALGPVLAGWLVSRAGFDAAYVIAGGVGVAALPLFVAVPDHLARRRPAAWQREAIAGIREAASDRRVLATSLAQAGQMFLNGSLNGFLPLFARETLGLEAGAIGLLFGVQTCSALLARPVFGRLSDRLGRRRMIVTGLISCAACASLIPAARGLPALLVLTAVYGAGLAMTAAATSAHISDLTRNARFGAAHGVFGTIYDVGDAAGPIAAGLLAAALGYDWMFRIMAAAAVAAAAGFAMVSRR